MLHCGRIGFLLELAYPRGLMVVHDRPTSLDDATVLASRLEQQIQAWGRRGQLIPASTIACDWDCVLRPLLPPHTTAPEPVQGPVLASEPAPTPMTAPTASAMPMMVPTPASMPNDRTSYASSEKRCLNELVTYATRTNMFTGQSELV